MSVLEIFPIHAKINKRHFEAKETNMSHFHGQALFKLGGGGEGGRGGGAHTGDLDNNFTCGRILSASFYKM